MDYEGSRPGIPIQLIIGVVIAIVGAVSYLGSSQVNPITGKRQSVALSPGQEISLGLQAAPTIAMTTPMMSWIGIPGRDPS